MEKEIKEEKVERMKIKRLRGKGKKVKLTKSLVIKRGKDKKSVEIDSNGKSQEKESTHQSDKEMNHDKENNTNGESKERRFKTDDKNEKKDEKDSDEDEHQVSISSTFYVRIFHMNIVFLCTCN